MTNDLKQWQKIRDACIDCYDYKNQGQWCSILNNKCTYQNCPKKVSPPKDITPPPVSDANSNGNNITSFQGGVAYSGGCTSRQEEAFKLSNDGLKPKEIAIRMGITRQAAAKLISKAHKKLHFKGLHLRTGQVASNKLSFKKGVADEVRLHDDCISFQIQLIEFPNILGKLIKWKNGIEHILIDDGVKQIRIFRKTLTIQWHKGQDIRAKTTDEAILKANQRIKEFTDTFHEATIISPHKQLKRHFGLVGNKLAVQKVKEGKKIIVYHPDGNVRHRIDTSKPPAELDNEHIITGKPDTDAWQRFMPKVDDGWDLKIQQMLEEVSKINQQTAMRSFDTQTTLAQIAELLKQIQERLR